MTGVLSAERLSAIAAPAEFTVTGDEVTGYEIADLGGEIRYYVRFDGTVYLVTRGERAGDEEFGFSTMSVDGVYRYLIWQLGNTAREILGYARIQTPHRSTDVAPGFTISVNGMRDILLHDGDVIGTLRHGGALAPAAQFSWLAALDVSALLASYLDESGAPLLSQWVTVPAGS